MIVAAIDSCALLLLLFSADADASPHVRREIERAVTKRRAILPIRLQDRRPSGAMEYALDNTQWLDAFAAPFEQFLAPMTVAVQALLTRKRRDPVELPLPEDPERCVEQHQTVGTERWYRVFIPGHLTQREEDDDNGDCAIALANAARAL